MHLEGTLAQQSACRSRKARTDHVFELLETRQIPASEANDRLLAMSERKKAVHLELAHLEGLTAAIASTQFNTDTIMARLREMAGRLLDLPEDRQRTVIQALVRGVVIDRGKTLQVTLAVPDPVKRVYPPFPVGRQVPYGDLDGT